ncbi:MAG: hypothetical protein LBP56_10905 [Odoribacteraceae bacterium]|jgi:hypothetical protein|nr:hypothetical protein [Odoribacteraceae bacterium]
MKYTYLLPLLLLVACFEDKGNYAYEPPVEIRLADNSLRDTAILRGQHLTLRPGPRLVVEGNEVAINPGDYTHAWRAYRRNLNDMTPVTLAETPDLDTTVFLPTRTEPYRVVYSITSKASGVERSFAFNLTVTSRFSSAWLYLTEADDGTAELMVRGTETATGATVLEGGVLERSGFPYRGGGAKFVYWYLNSQSIIVGTGEATGYLDRSNFEWNDTRLVRFMMALPAPVDHTFEKAVSLGPTHWFDSRGNLLPMSPTVGVIYAPVNILPPAVTGTGKYDTVQVAPHVAGTTSSQLFHDTKNKRVMVYKSTAANLKTYLEMLPPADRLANHRVFFMQALTNSRSVVIAKNLADGKYYRYTYSGVTLQANPEEITNGQLLEGARHMECDQPNGFFYVVSGNKLHAFRTNDDGTGELREVTITNRPGLALDEITYLGRYTLIASTAPHVILATYAGTPGSGKVYHLKANPTEPLELSVENEITGLDRVKSISRF